MASESAAAIALKAVRRAGWWGTMVTAAAVAAPTAAFLASRVLRSSGGESWADVETTTADLLTMDTLMLKKSVATVTFFEGDVDVAEAEIGRNCAALLRLNPWLCGRSRLSGGWKGSLTWPTKVDSFAPPPEDVFVRRDIEGLHRNTDFADLFRLLGDRITPPGPTDRNWLVTLVPDSESPTKRFCVVTCINHGVGDGHTYYKCHNMVVGATDPEPLVCERNREAAEEVDRMCPTRKEIFTVPFFLGIALRLLYGRVTGYEPAIRSFEVDDEWLAREKERAPKSNPQVKFVSSNDCVTSWFLRQCSQLAAKDAPTSGDMPVLGLMAVNFRGRVEGSNHALAGNYESMVYYLPGDFESPGLIRRSLATMRRCGSSPFHLFTRLRAPGGLISNWMTFCLPPKLPGSRELLHLPIFHTDELPPGWSLCLVFRSRGKQASIFVAGPPELLHQIEAEASGPTGAPIV
mmetsp:Transcript_6927/g.24997  ORF Transcript_6927/g.24997 Transcript_6927/m.24997 type:complete len:462 (-) Transcript_6927:1057-2442(-)